MSYSSLLGLILGLAAFLAWLAQQARPKILGLVYLNKFTGKRVSHMQVTPDAPLQLLAKGLDKSNNIVELPAGATIQSVPGDPAIASASASADGKSVTVTEVKIGNTVLNGDATLADGTHLTGSISLECVGGAPVAMTYVPATSMRR